MNNESLSAYQQTQHVFPKQQAKIIELMRQFPDGLIRHEISDCTGLKLQSVCGRTNELIASGILQKKTT